MFMFCLAFSMSLFISGVMLKRSFWGMGNGTIGVRTISDFFLLEHKTFNTFAMSWKDWRHLQHTDIFVTV